jgi:hypothetical protein
MSQGTIRRLRRFAIMTWDIKLPLGALLGLSGVAFFAGLLLH